MAALAAAIVAFLGGVAPAAAKSFRIEAIELDAELHADASMRVVEHITYDFDGEFHNGHRGIPRGAGYTITDLRVTDGATGESLPTEGSPQNLTWHFDASDEQRTFDLSYTVLGAASVGPDVGELYWQFVGEEHPRVGRVRVELQVPGDGLDVRAWAHGPLTGVVRPEGRVVRLAVDDLPSGQFVEARVTVPAGAFTARPSGGARLPGVLAEEQARADDANAQRQRAADAERRHRQVRDALQRWFVVAPVLGWIVFVVLWLRYGREYAEPVDVGEYVREPPDDPPAFVPMLRQWGDVPPLALSATIVDLAQRGYLTIEESREDRRLLPDKTDWRFTWRENPAPVLPFEHAVLSRLFDDGHTITQSELTAWCRRHQSESQRWWSDVQSKAKAAFKARGYIEGGKGPVFALNVVVAAAVGGLGFVAVNNGAPVGIAGIASAAVQLACTLLLRRRTPLGRRRLAEWEAFERFLRDHSQLGEAPIGHLILWERYLVYAVALGVTAEVARALAARIPAETAAQHGFAGWYSGPHGVGGLGSIGSLSEFTSTVGSGIVAASTPRSSGSGHGGGFSGGGGGGGGGGSVGAS